MTKWEAIFPLIFKSTWDITLQLAGIVAAAQWNHDRPIADVPEPRYLHENLIVFERSASG